MTKENAARERKRLEALTGRERDAAVWLMLRPHCDEVSLLLCRYVDGDVQPHAGYPVGHISPPHYTDEEAAAAINKWVGGDVGTM